MNLSSKVSIPSQVLARSVGDESVILDLASGTYFGLDPVGARMWQMFAEDRTLEQLCEVIEAEFEVTREQVERDVLRLVQELAARGLVNLPASLAD